LNHPVRAVFEDGFQGPDILGQRSPRGIPITPPNGTKDGAVLPDEAAIEDRYRTRLADLETIHREYPHDALRYLEKTQPHFQGSPSGDAFKKLAAEWHRTLPGLPKWFDLGACPGAQPGESASAAWSRTSSLRERHEKAKAAWRKKNAASRR